MAYFVAEKDRAPQVTKEIPADPSLPRVCVIGAGSSGLTAAKSLYLAGVPFDCFEKGGEIGGNWLFQNSNGQSACYETLETTLAAGTSTGAAKILQPIDVAKAVVKAVGRNRFEVTVPGWVGPVQRFVNILPQRLRDFVIRIMVPDQVKLVKRELRQDYEDAFFRPPGD